MPIYEFKCETDGVFAKIRPFAESANGATCPVCKIMRARIISVPSPAFVKGGTQAQKGGGGVRLGDLHDTSWIDG